MVLYVSANVINLLDAATEARTAAEVGRCLFSALRSYGARAIYARSMRSALPGDEHIYSRISPAGWEELYSERRFAESNYLVREVRRRSEPFRWSDADLRTDRERELARVLAELNIPDGIGAPVHGPGGYLGVTSIAFERLDQIPPEEQTAIGIACTVLHHRMRTLTSSELIEPPRLTHRERDCLALIAQGNSDWEISEILGIAATTVLTHVQNARRKLGARSRAQAVAICVAMGVI